MIEWDIIHVLLDHLQDIIGGILDIIFFIFIQNINLLDTVFGYSAMVLIVVRRQPVRDK